MGAFDSVAASAAKLAEDLHLGCNMFCETFVWCKIMFDAPENQLNASASTASPKNKMQATHPPVARAKLSNIRCSEYRALGRLH